MWRNPVGLGANLRRTRAYLCSSEPPPAGRSRELIVGSAVQNRVARCSEKLRTAITATGSDEPSVKPTVFLTVPTRDPQREGNQVEGGEGSTPPGRPAGRR